jgi:hypothetical protein
MVRKLGKEAGTRELTRLRKAFARKASTWKKLQVECAVLRGLEIKFKPWERDFTALVGNFAFDMLLHGLPDVIANDKGIPRISAEAARDIGINFEARPIREPSTEPPFPWFSFDGVDGDTFVAACRDVPAVRAAIHKGIPHVDAVNYLRGMRWRVNEHVLSVVKRRRLLKKVADDDPAAQSLLEQNIDLAERYRAQPFYVPLNVDFRGRLISGGTFNFTGPDHIRGLFEFAEGAPITERGIRWLKIACATAFDEWKISRDTLRDSTGRSRISDAYAMPAGTRWITFHCWRRPATLSSSLRSPTSLPVPWRWARTMSQRSL